MKPFLKMGNVTIFDDMELIDKNFEMSKYLFSTDNSDWKFCIQINRTMRNKGFTPSDKVSVNINFIRYGQDGQSYHSPLSHTFKNNFDIKCHLFTNTHIWVWKMFGISEEILDIKVEILYEKLKIRGLI